MTETVKPNPWKTVFLATSCWIFFIGILLLLSSTTSHLFPLQIIRLVYGVAGILAALAAIWVVMKFESAEERIQPPFIEKAIFGKFAAGFLIGTIFIGIIVVVLLLFTDMKFESNQKFSISASWLSYLAIIPLALMEEIAFRGWSFRKLNQRFDIRVTQLIVAVGFALYHVNGYGIAASFAGPFVWAFIFGLAAWLTRGIAVATGIHVALNIIQVLLGFKNSESAVWKIDPGQDLTNINNIGLIMQFIFLAFGVYLTFYFHRKRLNQVGLNKG